MKKLTLEQVKQDCALMWDWLRKNPTATKHDFVLKASVATARRFRDYPSLCAACHYANQEDLECKDCPLRWPTKYQAKQSCSLSFYGDWLDFMGNHHTANQARIAATEILKLALCIKTK